MIRRRRHSVRPLALALSCLLGCPLAWLALGAVRPASAPPADTIHLTGTVTGWRIAMHGGIYVRLRHDGSAGDSPGREAWFATPPDRGDAHDVERILVAVLLASEDDSPRETLTLSGSVERQLDGKTIESAYPLVAVARP